jgi:ubiquinone/menaquinone biosynthesis C-methylase UbiE
MNRKKSIPARVLARLNRLFRKPQKPQYFETEAYKNWLIKNGEDLYRHFYSQYATFEGKQILDVGCGYGGKAIAYGKYNPKTICGVDISLPVLQEAKNYLADCSTPVSLLAADVAALPFPDATFDVIISDDGFDHFKDSKQALKEITRLLKPDGIAFISFVPYFANDCSHMTEYLRVPWHHALFSRKAIREALDLVADYDAKQANSDLSAVRSGVDGVFNTFLNHLSRLSLRRFKAELKTIHGVKLIRFRKRSKNWARPLTYAPMVNELFTDCVYCVLKKETEAEIKAFNFLQQIGMDIRQDLAAIGRKLSGKRLDS